MIAYGMLYAIAVGLPLFLAASLASAVVRGRGGPERAVWLVALTLALTLPVAALVSQSPAPPDPGTAPFVETGLVGLPTVVSVPAAPRAPLPMAPPPLGLDEALLALWILASLVLATRWAVASIRLARLEASWPYSTIDGVRVRLAPDVGPAVTGVLKPRIVVPSWLASLPREQRSLVLLHEQEHVRARDPLLGAASRLVRIVAPWNPIVWLLSSRLLRAVELDCDRRVLRRCPDVRTYGATLLTVSSRDPGALAGVAAFAETDAPLRRRILAMTTPRSTVSVVGLLSATVLGVVLLAAVFEIPIPTLRMQIEVSPVDTDAAASTVEPARADGATSIAVPVASGTVSVSIRTSVTDAPLRNAQVWVPGSGLGGLSDDGGRLLLRVPVGEHHVVAHQIGYGEVERAVTVSEGETVDVELRLQQTAVELEPIVVAAGEARRPEPSPTPAREGSSAPTTRPMTSSAIPGQPVFTPYSVAPRVSNVHEVRRAMLKAYPPELRARGTGGTVQVWFFVTEEGRVRDTRIAQSSGHRALDRAALTTAVVYRFTPALNRDQPVPVWVSFPVTFVPGEA